jgi:hypothetical protein
LKINATGKEVVVEELTVEEQLADLAQEKISFKTFC